MKGPITTLRERCRKCYSCVRNCPVKAIKVDKDHAEIIDSRCIGCGICVRVCSQQAKVIADSIPTVQSLMQGPDPVIAILGSSYPAFFNDIRPGQLVAGIKALGFSEVHEGASGVELIRRAYQTEIENQEKSATPLISSHCPAIVDLIEHHYPQLLRNLLKTEKKERQKLQDELDQRETELDEMEKTSELWKAEKKECMRLRDEIAGRKEVLAARLGNFLPVFCYPSGDYNATLRRAVEAAGFEAHGLGRRHR